jgi:hypothetical protein
MKSTTLGTMLGSIALAACGPVTSAVDVDTAGSSDISGFVALCDKHTPLTRHEGRLAAAVPVTCEGTGVVRLQSGDGVSVDCQIGYVSPQLDQSFSFTLEGSVCVPVAKTT